MVEKTRHVGSRAALFEGDPALMEALEATPTGAHSASARRRSGTIRLEPILRACVWSAADLRISFLPSKRRL